MYYKGGELSSTLVLLTFLTTPTVITLGFSAMGCSQPIGGTQYLRLDYTVTCWTTNHQIAVGMAALMITLLGIVFPILMAVLLCKANQDSEI